MTDNTAGERYTASALRALILDRKIDFVPLHECSICGYQCGWQIGANEYIWYDSGCYCTGGGGGYVGSFEDIANVFAIQSSDNIRERMYARLFPGILTEDCDAERRDLVQRMGVPNDLLAPPPPPPPHKTIRLSNADEIRRYHAQRITL